MESLRPAAFCSLMRADLRAVPAADSPVGRVAAAAEDLQLRQKAESEVRHEGPRVPPLVA